MTEPRVLQGKPGPLTRIAAMGAAISKWASRVENNDAGAER